MATFVLVHGAWHGGWCWHQVVELLARAGHRALAPDLPGHGDDTAGVHGLGLSDYADSLAPVLDAAGEPVVLVGHSMGGGVISLAAERWPERVAQLVYVCAFMPRGEASLATLAASDADTRLNRYVEYSADRTEARVRPEGLRDAFYHDCPEADVALARERLCAESPAAFVEPVRVTAERFGRVPRDYVLCEQDRAVTPAFQAWLIEGCPVRRVERLDTGHSPFFAAPDRLSDVLVDLASPAA